MEIKSGSFVRRLPKYQGGAWWHGSMPLTVNICNASDICFKEVEGIWKTSCFELLESEYNLSPYQKWERSLKNETITV